MIEIYLKKLNCLLLRFRYKGQFKWKIMKYMVNDVNLVFCNLKWSNCSGKTKSNSRNTTFCFSNQKSIN